MLSCSPLSSPSKSATMFSKFQFIAFITNINLSQKQKTCIKKLKMTTLEAHKQSWERTEVLLVLADSLKGSKFGHPARQSAGSPTATIFQRRKLNLALANHSAAPADCGGRRSCLLFRRMSNLKGPRKDFFPGF